MCTMSLLRFACVVSLAFAFVSQCTTKSIGDTVEESMTCSRFDYEIKLIERLLRIENKMTNVEEKVGTFKSDIDEFGLLTERVMDMERTLVNMRETFEQERKSLNDLVVKNTAAFNESLIDSIEKMTNDFQKMQSLSKETLTKFGTEMNQRLTEKNNLQKVSLTGCVSTYKKHTGGSILKFDDVRSSVGINDLTSYKASGKFVVEVQGMYLVIVSVLAYDNNGEVGIYKNGDIITRMYKGSENNILETGSTSAAMLLKKGDNVWIQVMTATRIEDSKRSCLTIVKIQ